MPRSNAPAARPLRLFLALWPDAATRAALIAQQNAWAWPAGTGLVKPQRLHLTLHFLGDVPACRLPELAAGLLAPFRSFSLALDQAEVWPQGVAVLGAKRTPHALAALHGALSGALHTMGLPVEVRPFRPHVTLARRAQGASPPQRRPPVHWRADQGYVLVRSLPGGAGYEVVERFG